MFGRHMCAKRETRGLRTLAMLAMAAALVLPGAMREAVAQDRRIVTVDEADYFGGDYKTLKDVDLEACKAACVDDRQCKAFTFNTSAGWCFLKSDVGSLQSFAGAIAGLITNTGASGFGLGGGGTSPLPTVLGSNSP